MTSLNNSFKLLVLAGLLCASAGFALAQPGPAAAPCAPGSRAEGMGRQDPAKMQARMGQRLAAFKAKLQLTSAQEAAWTAFTATIQPTPRAGKAAMATAQAELDKLPTPERLDRMRALHAQHMSEMSQQMTQRAEATKTFYDALTPAQKDLFDKEFSRAASRQGPAGAMRHSGPMG